MQSNYSWMYFLCLTNTLIYYFKNVRFLVKPLVIYQLHFLVQGPDFFYCLVLLCQNICLWKFWGYCCILLLLTILLFFKKRLTFSCKNCMPCCDICKQKWILGPLTLYSNQFTNFKNLLIQTIAALFSKMYIFVYIRHNF